MHATSSTYTNISESRDSYVRGTEYWRRGDKLTACLYYREAVSTLQSALENEADLHVNERHKIRHYRGRSTEERRKKKKNAK